RGDLYSVGVILFEVLTGKLPFACPTVEETLKAHASKRPPRFADVDPTTGVPPAVEELVQVCLSKYPVERPQDARELVERYERALGRKLARAQDWFHPVAGSGITRLPGLGPKKVDPRAVVHHLEAWMPERIAVVKLQGFVHDIGGEVV